MAKKKIDLTKFRPDIQCFCERDTKEEEGRVIDADDFKDCECILQDGQGLADSVVMDRVVISKPLGEGIPGGSREFRSSRTVRGISADEVTNIDPKFDTEVITD